MSETTHTYVGNPTERLCESTGSSHTARPLTAKEPLGGNPTLHRQHVAGIAVFNISRQLNTLAPVCELTAREALKSRGRKRLMDSYLVFKLGVKLTCFELWPRLGG